MKKTYFAILGAAAILSLATACSSTNVNESTANESSQSASSGSSSNGMDESSPMDDLKEDAKDTLLPSEGTADTKQSTMTGTISDIKDFMFTITDQLLLGDRDRSWPYFTDSGCVYRRFPLWRSGVRAGAGCGNDWCGHCIADLSAVCFFGRLQPDRVHAV